MDAADARIVDGWPILPSYEELLRENADLKRQLIAAHEEIRALRRTVDQLRQRVEELLRPDRTICAARANVRAAAVSRKHDEPPAEPKKPGRKPGRRYGRHAHREAPPRIDEMYHVPLPRQCPHCRGGRLKKTSVVSQYQTEIPRQVIYRQFDVEVGVCRDCGHSVEGRHELMTSTARGAASSQLGANVHALLAIMNKQCGLSYGKCVNLLSTAYEGLKVSRRCRVCLFVGLRSTAAQGCQAAHEQICREVHDSKCVTPMKPAGASPATTPGCTSSSVREPPATSSIRRAAGDPPWKNCWDWIIRARWCMTAGACTTDSASARINSACDDLQRRCEGLVAMARGMAANLPRAVLDLIDTAYRCRRMWRGHRITASEQAEAGLRLSNELDELVRHAYCNPSNRRLAGHVRAAPLNWFWFLIDPTIAATNYEAEQGLRGAVVNRKVWGGNRTWPGAQVQATLMSILRTCWQRLIPPFGFLVQATSTAPAPSRYQPEAVIKYYGTCFLSRSSRIGGACRNSTR